MGWSVEVHERQRLAEAAAAKRPRRAAPAQPRPIESGVWQVAAGSKTVTALAAAVLAALWARRSSTRQQRLATAKRPESLLGRVGGAIAARLQALGVADILDRGRGRGPSGGGSGKQRQRKPAPRPPAARAAGEAALQRSSAAAAAAAVAAETPAAAAVAAPAAAGSPAAPAPAAQPNDGSSGGSGSLGSPQQPGAYLDVAPGSAPAAPAQPPPHARPAEQRGGQRKKKGKGKRKK